MPSSNFALIPVDHDPFQDLPKGELGLRQGPMGVKDWLPFVGEALKIYGKEAVNSLIASAKLPGKVLQGKIDPNSEEGFGQTLGLAGMVSGGPIGGALPKGAVTAMGWNPKGEIAKTVAAGLEGPKALPSASAAEALQKLGKKVKGAEKLQEAFPKEKPISKHPAYLAGQKHPQAESTIYDMLFHLKKGKDWNTAQKMAAAVWNHGDAEKAAQYLKEYEQKHGKFQWGDGQKPTAKLQPPYSGSLYDHPLWKSPGYKELSLDAQELASDLLFDMKKTGKSAGETIAPLGDNITKHYKEAAKFLDDHEAAVGKFQWAPEEKLQPEHIGTISKHPAHLAAPKEIQDGPIYDMLSDIKHNPEKPITEIIKEFKETSAEFTDGYSLEEIDAAAKHLLAYEKEHGKFNFAKEKGDEAALKNFDPYSEDDWEGIIGTPEKLEKGGVTLAPSAAAKGWEKDLGPTGFSAANIWASPYVKRQPDYEKAISLFDWMDRANATPELAGLNAHRNALLAAMPHVQQAEALGFNTAMPLVRGANRLDFDRTPWKFAVQEEPWMFGTRNPDLVGPPNPYASAFPSPASKTNEPGIFLADTPKVSNKYADVVSRAPETFPLYARAERAGVAHWPEITGGDMQYTSKHMQKLLQAAREKGLDLLSIESMSDLGGPQTQYVVFEPNRLRSVYAAFDSNYRETPNLLLSQGNPIGSVAFAPKGEKDEKRKRTSR